MNNILVILIGVLITITLSLFGLVLIPSWQFEQMPPVEVAAADGTTVMYPSKPDAEVAQGREVYRSMGCLYCHSQQVRPEGFGADLDRGWGQRRSVPRDYVLQNPTLLGTMRTGPDLANIGFRQPNDEWHYLHLYDPVILSPGSTMPPHRFLFELVSGSLDPKYEEGVTAFKVPSDYLPEPSWIVPSPRAKQLIAYLKSLQQPYSLEEIQ